MVSMRYIIPLLLATAASADFYIDNANSSVQYAMAPSQTGQPDWQTFSASTRSLELSITNSTGNYTILLDASQCYDQNYALGVCGVGDGCFVSIPFIGSGITMYVFNAGASGMTASFAVDGAPAVTNSTNAPPGPTFQVPRVPLYNIQGLTSGNHTMVMTVLDWDGSPTSMKFDYAYVNESLVAAPATTSSMTSTSASQTPSQTSTESLSSSQKTNIGAIVGGTIGGVSAVASVVFGLLYWRKRKARQQDSSPSESAEFQVHPFTSEYHSSPTPPLFSRPLETKPSVLPLLRSAILRDALAAGAHPSPPQSSRSGMSSAVLQPVRGPSTDGDLYSSGVSRTADPGLPFSDSQMSQFNLTEEQLEVIDQLQADSVPLETIARVIEGFVASRLEADETRGRRKGLREVRSISSAAPPPSYQTRDR